MPKTYDQAYFDRWYRSAPERLGAAARRARKVAAAVAIAELVLERPIRSVLDVGCGEGAWRAPLLALRPGLRYLGLDPSEYAVRRWGARRGLLRAGFGDLAHYRPCPPVDLLVCSDVLHYLPMAELKRGLPGLAELVGGVAWLDCYARGDAIEGDLEGFQARPASTYRRLFAGAGLAPVGPCSWAPAGLAGALTALERVPAG